MKLLRSIRHKLNAFRRDEDGSVSVELVMMAPLFAWAWLATVVYFDTYRTEAIAVKATTTVADMVSRETNAIDGTYLNNIRKLLAFLTNADTTPDYRLTVITWNENNSEYRVRWSRERGSQPTLNKAMVNDMAGQMPDLKDGQRAIIVETWTDYNPSFGVGLQPSTFENLMVITPRFASQLCFEKSDGTLRC